MLCEPSFETCNIDAAYAESPTTRIALYIGDGKIIHASNAATGIKISDYDYEKPAAVGTFME